MPSTNQQRREAAARRLQKQLEERRARETARKRTTLIASIVGTVVLIAAVIVVVVVTSGDNTNKTATQPGGDGHPTTHPTTPITTSSAPPLAAPVACAAPPKGATAAFHGVTVTGGTDLQHAPTVKSLSEKAPKALECMDLVVGTGKPASPASTVSVQYIGVLYQNGTKFDSSWDKGGQPVQFPLNRVVPGFTQGIGGTGKVAPMREGGRRIMILPAALGYGAQSNGSIPANAPLVFVVDLTSVDS